MMRNLEDYKRKYECYAFEEIQAKYRKRSILDLIKKTGPKKILEVGCGLDPLFNYLDQFEIFCVVEPTKAFFSNAMEVRKNSHLSSRIVLRKNFIEEDLEFLSSKKFDFAVIAGLLHEVENPSLVLESVRRILPKGARLYVNVPNAQSFHRLLAMKAHLIQNQFELSDSNRRFQQHSVFDKSSILKLLKANGFRVIDSGTIFIKPFTHHQMQSLIDHKIIDENILDGLYNLTDIFPDNGSEIFVDSVAV